VHCKNYNYKLMPTNPCDVMPIAHCDTRLDVKCDQQVTVVSWWFMALDHIHSHHQMLSVTDRWLSLVCCTQRALAKFSKWRAWDKVSEGNILIFGDTLITLKKISQHKPVCQKSVIRAAISIKCQHVTDTQPQVTLTALLFCTALQKP